MMGKSGRAMLDALVSGTTDPVVLVGRILAHIDYLDDAIDELSGAIEEQLGPFAPAVELLCTIPGVGRRAAEVIIAEIAVT
jgi:transposase